jgi:hypothetical protein
MNKRQLDHALRDPWAIERAERSQMTPNPHSDLIATIHNALWDGHLSTPEVRMHARTALASLEEELKTAQELVAMARDPERWDEFLAASPWESVT